MARLLLRLLLIVSLATNGLASPWAMAHAGPAPTTSRAAHAAMPVDCHHRAHGGEAAHAGHQGHASAMDEAPSQRPCCGDPDCKCGCVLHPMLSHATGPLQAIAWTAAPEAVPAIRATPPRAGAPFRPPAP